MIAIIQKEINSFFSSAIGYLVIAIFLIVNGLFLWVFPGTFNIFDSGFAELSAFFELAPWVLLFLIPAVTMRAFSDEYRMGTIEILVTRPLALWQIVLGKFLGSVLLILLALVPTLLYIISIDALGNPSGNWDVGSTVGSYIGLLFLVFSYTAIGVFASTLSHNQVVAFITAVFVCFLLYYGFESLDALLPSVELSYFGLKSHFDSVARGVLDTRDIVYFLSISALFLVATGVQLNTKKR
ncbi:gliding motility-associated ABC transporter permease subunit GldF [Altibacter sp. HG106]|uniref:gliding motility-associated ABC transporter permease subunit GldF n=1 Tax=Altibacter sp. HG106 TaxID=3023937 RepID=UPI002350FAF2|nr:gliding motility-associated ABC transporter permease subunit GldF [Altibacter sp. HG106]MDC7995306.1 gliding motility-associated ABC transporter permease subunit GldF [Altibacter sp. HG106]